MQEELAVNIRKMLRYKKMNPYYLIAIKVEMQSQIVRQVKMKKKLWCYHTLFKISIFENISEVYRGVYSFPF